MLDDPAPQVEQVTRLVITSGKLYYDIAGHERRSQAPHVAVARLEQLYPFPVKAAAKLVGSYPALKEVVWAQEEPQNMGRGDRSGTASRKPSAGSRSGTPVAPGARARARAIPRHTRGRRTGSSAKCSSPRVPRDPRRRRAASTARAIRGPCVRALAAGAGAGAAVEFVARMS